MPDNVAVEGSDGFDVLVRNLKLILTKNPGKKEEIEQLEAALNRGKRYLKGKYKSNCREIESDIADHCRNIHSIYWKGTSECRCSDSNIRVLSAANQQRLQISS